MSNNTNGYFGQIQGPFKENTEIITDIKSQCKTTVNFISKIGIHCVRQYDLDITGKATPLIEVSLNFKNFIIGKTGMLELNDVQITSIMFKQAVDNKTYIDYQYK